MMRRKRITMLDTRRRLNCSEPASATSTLGSLCDGRCSRHRLVTRGGDTGNTGINAPRGAGLDAAKAGILALALTALIASRAGLGLAGRLGLEGLVTRLCDRCDRSNIGLTNGTGSVGNHGLLRRRGIL